MSTKSVSEVCSTTTHITKQTVLKMKLSRWIGFVLAVSVMSVSVQGRIVFDDNIAIENESVPVTVLPPVTSSETSSSSTTSTTPAPEESVTSESPDAGLEAESGTSIVVNATAENELGSNDTVSHLEPAGYPDTQGRTFGFIKHKIQKVDRALGAALYKVFKPFFGHKEHHAPPPPPQYYYQQQEPHYGHYQYQQDPYPAQQPGYPNAYYSPNPTPYYKEDTGDSVIWRSSNSRSGVYFGPKEETSAYSHYAPVTQSPAPAPYTGFIPSYGYTNNQNEQQQQHRISKRNVRFENVDDKINEIIPSGKTNFDEPEVELPVYSNDQEPTQILTTTNNNNNVDAHGRTLHRIFPGFQQNFIHLLNRVTLPFRRLTSPIFINVPAESRVPEGPEPVPLKVSNPLDGYSGYSVQQHYAFPGSTGHNSNVGYTNLLNLIPQFLRRFGHVGFGTPIQKA